MKNGASPQEDDSSRPQDPLTLFDHFVGIQHDDHPPLKPFEVAKLDDLRDDMVLWGDPKAHHPKLSFLGRVFARYEKRWSLPLRPASHEASRERSEYALLDQLSVRYGGQYRGVIAANCRLAMIASCVGETCELLDR